MTIMLSLTFYKIMFMVELLIAELLFMLRLKKRKYFYWRLASSYLICLLVAIFIPLLSYDALYSSALFLLLTAISFFGLWFCYSEPLLNVLYCVTAAYTMRHLAFQFYSVFLAVINGSGAVTANLYNDSNLSSFSFDENTILSILGYVSCYFIVFTLCYTFFGSKIGKDGDFEMKKPNLMVWVIIVLFVDIILNAIVVYNSKEENFVNGRTLFIGSLCTYSYNILCCFFMLYIQYTMIDMRKLKKELSIVNHLWQQEREQFKISKENIDLINRKCHDLKYQIGKIVSDGEMSRKQKEEIGNMISIYDSMIKTGNEALDVIFTEKSLACHEKNIKLNYMVDGKQLSFMETEDIYVLFGNLMDNAIEAVEKLEDKDKRCISMNVYTENDSLQIDMSNYFDGAISLNNEGMPQTTKGENGYHGFGLRSVCLIVKNYGGTTCFSADNNIFTFDINIPLH